eukprot:348187_1
MITNECSSILFCIYKWNVYVGNTALCRFYNCCLYLSQPKQNTSTLHETLRENLYHILMNIGINYKRRLKTLHYFLSLVSYIIILLLFPSSILTIVGTTHD